MIIISSRLEKIARVLCSCCYEDHFFDIEANTNYLKIDPDDCLFYFEFKQKDFQSLKDRLRTFKCFLRNKFQFKSLDSILIDLDQLRKIVEVLKSYSTTFGFEEEYTRSLDVEEIKFIKMDYYDKKRKDSFDLVIFNKNDLIINLDCVKDDGKLYYYDIEIGFNPTNFSLKKRISLGLSYLFAKGKSVLRDYEVSINKDDFMELIRTLNYIKNNSEPSERGILLKTAFQIE
jgi:hypothetical protein